MDSIFLENVKFKISPEIGGKIPRDRYKEYLYDLYKIYPGKVSEESFLEGSQLTYAELGDSLFESAGMQEKLAEIDLIILAHWSQEFDPDYASCGPYFLNKYKMKADIFDVCDQGTLAPFTALNILIQYLKQKRAKKVMLLCLEQTTIPRDKLMEDVIPLESGAVAIILGTDEELAKLKVVCSEIIPETISVDNLRNIDDFIMEELRGFNISQEKTLIFLRKNTLVQKIIHKKIFEGETSLLENQLRYLEQKPGCLSVFKRLDSISKENEEYRFFLIIDEDVESLNMGYMLLERAYEKRI